MEDQLPDALRRSSLKWEPDDEGQSPAYGPHDSWTASLGALEWTIVVHQDGLGSPTFLLSLRNYALEDEVSAWTFPSLSEAALAASSTKSLLLEQLRRAVRNPR